jgi:hypothetical protein
MKKRLAWIGAGVLVLLIAAAAYLLLARPPAARMLGLVASGGERLLREPLRPPGDGPRVLVFALDGVGDDELLAAVRSGRAPAIAALLGAEHDARVFAHGYAVPEVLSILPSTTMAAWASLFTGAGAAHTGVPGNEWFARDEMRFYAPAPVSVEGSSDALKTYTDNLVGDALRTRTLYERANVRSYVALSQIHRGADLLIVPAADALDDLIRAAFEGLSDDDESVGQEAYVNLDRSAIDNVVDAIGEHGVADLQVIYFPGVDLYTHVADQPLDRQRAYVTEVIDAAVGRIVQLYRAAGAFDDTYVLFVSDHGHTPVLNDDRHAIGSAPDDELATLLTRTGFRLRPPRLELDDDEHDFQATFAFQGAFAYVYLADRSTCTAEGSVCDWTRGPRLAEDVLPVVRALDAANRSGVGAPTMRGVLDLILTRPPRPTTEDALPFQVWDGTSLVDVGQYLVGNPRPDLLDLERRLHALGAGPYGHRAGDVLLLAKSGSSRPIDERFYFSARYRSWHGSPDEQDSTIPLIVAHGRQDGSALRARVEAAIGGAPNQEDIAALILNLLQR